MRNSSTSLPGISQRIWEEKYRLMGPDGSAVDRTLSNTWERVARAVAAAEPKRVRAHWAKLFGEAMADFAFLPHDRERGYDLVELLQTIARKHDAVPAQVALAWLLTRPTVSTLLVGAASVKQLDENLGATDIALDAEDLAQLDTATRPTPPYPNWFTDRVADAQAHEALGIPLAERPVR